ncbi:protein C2-DOMAIN ABA-RELATED 1-like [Corylus avellana]|uniref:protein C2-DOMAIN ABA-RELATED 1-like n=1 Tax=Corylus avellana TaxID=13451 RepID=UPI001E20AC82|nr:protein C2-DOMAIN ABA-RELATED 1-like [Corylus avellana]
MENWIGLLKIHVQKGVNLAVRDVIKRSSDPYVIFHMGNQRVKTSVVRRSINPVWNEELTLSITDPSVPIKLFVYDKDTFSPDDKMGDAEFEIGPFVEALKQRRSEGLENGHIFKTVKADRQNCLAEESHIIWKDNRVVQNMVLRLRNVERGEVELQLQWRHISGSRGF